MTIKPLILSCVWLGTLAICAHRSVSAQAPSKTSDSEDGHFAGASGAPEGRVRPYEQVIPAGALTKVGVFTVHQIDSKIYYEIPTSELDKDFLWVSRLAKAPFDVGAPGSAREPLNTRVVNWKRRGNRVLLYAVSYELVADKTLPVARAVEAQNNDTILKAFDIEAFGKSEAPVIDVSKLLITEVPEFSARVDLGAEGFDESRSFVERVMPYPQNIEVDVTQTYTTSSKLEHPPLGWGPMSVTSATTILMHYSMVKLPENPMQPRLFDARVGFGFFGTTNSYDYGREQHRAVRLRYIKRWRLEKKNPSEALSEPVKPIVYYIDSATPKKWRPWIRRGIEEFQAAFEMAGFKDAIVVRDAPSPQEDPSWSPDDIRYSVIRWVPSQGSVILPSIIVDPRTGEILNAGGYLEHNSLNYLRDAYFATTAPLDPRAQKLPFSDDLMGRLLQGFVAHEIGHTLGLGHNLIAGATYPADKLRDPSWLGTMGYTASISQFPVFDYVAQPQDGVSPDDLIQGLGPYDKWVIRWGYAPIAGALTPDAEKPTLDAWAREQDSTPWLQFSAYRWDPYHPVDPRDIPQGVGGSDPVYSTELGIKNLQRVMDLLLAATSHPGEPYDDLKEIHSYVLGYWVMEMCNVAVLVGGVQSQLKYGGQRGALFAPIPRERQQAAVRFLNQEAFKTPFFLIRSDVIDRIVPSGGLQYIGIVQRSVLDQLLENARLGRLVEQGARFGEKAYHLDELLRDLRRGIWHELTDSEVKIDPYRSQVQRDYVRLLVQKINAPEVSLAIVREVSVVPVEPQTTTGLDAIRPYLQAELKALRLEIARARPRASDGATRAHLDAVSFQIDRTLDPRSYTAGPECEK